MDNTRSALIQAIYGQESGYGRADTSKANYAGARGPMQITLDTFNGLKRNGSIPADWEHGNPEHSTQAGITLINQLADKYNDDPAKVAAAYYAGEKAVRPDGTIAFFKDLKNPKAPSTHEYVAQVLGRMGQDGQMPVGEDAPPSRPTGPVGLDTPMPGLTPKGKQPKALPALESLPDTTPVIRASPAQTLADAQKDEAVYQKAAQEVADTSVLDSARAQFMHNGILGALGKMSVRPAFEDEPGFTVDPKNFAGKSADDILALREAGSQKELDWLLFDQQDAAEQARVSGLRGTGTSLMGGFISGFPEGYLTGMGAFKAFQMAKVGSTALALEGRVGAAWASAAAENIGGNVAGLAISDAMGQHVGTDDYAMAVGFGMLVTPLSAWGSLGEAAKIHADNAANRIASEAAAKIEAKRAKAVENLGENATPEQILAEMQRMDAAEVQHTLSVDKNRKLIDEPVDEVGQPEVAPKTVDEGSLPNTKTKDEYAAETGFRPYSLTEPGSGDGILANQFDLLPERVQNAEANHKSQLDKIWGDIHEVLSWPDGVNESRFERVYRTSGIKLDEVRGYDPGVHVVATKANTFPAAKTVEMVKWVQKHFLNDMKVVLQAGDDLPSNHLGDHWYMGENTLRLRTRGDVNTTLHELGHAIFTTQFERIKRTTAGAKYLEWQRELVKKYTSVQPTQDKVLGATQVAIERGGLASGETMAALRATESADYTPTLFDVMSGVASQVRDGTLSKSNVSRAKDARHYFFNSDEIGAESFVKYVEGTVAGLTGVKIKVPSEVISFFKDLWDMFERLFNTAKEKGWLAPDQRVTDFFEAVRAVNKADITKADRVNAGLDPKAGSRKPSSVVPAEPSAQVADILNPKFQKWFRNSKVQDADGKPLVVYHGTTGDITRFEKSNLGSNTQAASAKRGFFFTSSPTVASGYALLAEGRAAQLISKLENLARGTSSEGLKQAIARRIEDIRSADKSESISVNGVFGVTDANVMPVYLKMENPKVVDYGGKTYREQTFDSVIREAEKDGHDGVIFRNAEDSAHKAFSEFSDIYMVFDGSQVKSALGNSGEFSPGNADINARIAPTESGWRGDPIAAKYGLSLLPDATPAQAAEAKAILSLYKRADDPKAPWNNIDPERVKSLTDNSLFNVASTSLLMLKSDNPVVRMVAAELLENPAGAAGRRGTAALATHMNMRKFTGNIVPDIQDAYKVWRTQHGGSVFEDVWGGKKWEQFNTLVAEEIEGRRTGNPSQGHPAVVAAANAAEAAFERMRVAQVTAKTIGWGGLPETSVGYMPHRLSPEKIRNMTTSQRETLHASLVDQFVSIEGFDISFSAQLASQYIDRVNLRAVGGYDAPVNIHQVGAADMVEDALTAMGLSKPEVVAQMQKYMRGSAGHTKGRLKLDLLKRDENGFRLLDLYDTNIMNLVRSQANRVAGEVALAEFGVMGQPGLKLLKQAMTHGGDVTKAQNKELEAFDQVAAEFLGQPFGTNNSKWADRVLMTTSLARLGGMGFTQFAEAINGIWSLGAAKALGTIPEFPRLRAEAKALARGEHVDNGILGSIEKYSGVEFGADSYKIKFPFDNGSLEHMTYGKDSVTFADRVLRGATHLQGKLSLWRSIHAAQHRGMAEQIVAKAARYLSEGKNDAALRDMGITDALAARLRADINQAATFEGGRLKEFDVTKFQDTNAANEFIQAIHRGTSQIIQGTFIGETGSWAHDGLLRILTQFRTFSITSIEKQWARQRGNYGVAGALGILMGSMALAAPIYMARTALSSIGRPDRDEYLDRQLTVTQIARASLNYVAVAGLSGDLMDALTALTGTGELTGGRSGAQSQFVGNVVAPSAGLADDLWRAMQNNKDGTDPHDLIKNLPFSKLPVLQQAINALGK